MHPVKRRKLDAVNSTLIKPFRSPLKGNNTNVSTNQSRHNDIKVQRPPTASALSQLTDTSGIVKSADHALIRTGLAKANTHSGALLTSALSQQSNVDILQKQYTALARKLTSLRQTLDTAQQAVKVESTNQSQELDVLIAKWKGVVRETAEELFVDAKQRVDKEGGVQSWLKRQEKEPPDVWYEARQSKLSEVQRQVLAEQQKEDMAEAVKYGLVEEEEQGEEEETTTFTIDQMLRQMNVSLDLVGYDTEQQRWID